MSNGVVLIVDDSPVNRKIIQMILKRQNFDTVLAVDGQDAIDTVKNAENKFCLILMDQNMPIMDGTNATKAIKEFDPSIPIVGLTTEVDPTTLENFVRAGVCGLYSKPVSANEMKKIMRKHSL